ncbi:major facilitator transporter [Gorgonomyces haynaldii]|nr:major facilitator transporter [Gorgonomyces haynaldii]
MSETILMQTAGEQPQTEHKPINFYVIAGSYLVFTISDSALRMIVLFELYSRSFDALAIAVMFSWYELVGVVTNLLGGIMGTNYGLKSTLLLGLGCQLLGIALLSLIQISQDWNKYAVIVFVTFIQTFSGVAKDLVKVAGKSSTKLVKVLKHAEGNDALFSIVAWLTGAKNSVKGFGFFFGALLINFCGYWQSLLVLFCLLLPLMPLGFMHLDKNIGKSKHPTKLTFQQMFKKDPAVNTLSVARLFLFCSRDIWFEVVLPIYLRSQFGWQYVFAGTVLAVWIIFYGIFQSATPRYVLQTLGRYPIRHGTELVPWTIALFVITLGLSLFETLYTPNDVTHVSVFLAGIFVFGFIFAVNSSIHSFLIVSYADKDKISQTVGFYYMANAGGRLVGTLLSGVLYYYVGMYSCLWASCASIILTWIASHQLQPVKE